MAENSEHVTPPTPYQAAVQEANRIRLPRHVLDAYQWVPLKDVFMDGKGRLWFAETDTLRQQLPADPISYGKRPPEFAHPATRRWRSYDQHEQQRRAWENERSDQFQRKPVLVP